MCLKLTRFQLTPASRVFSATSELIVITVIHGAMNIHNARLSTHDLTTTFTLNRFRVSQNTIFRMNGTFCETSVCVHVADLWFWSGKVERIHTVTDAIVKSGYAWRIRYTHSTGTMEQHQPASNCEMWCLRLCHSTLGANHRGRSIQTWY